MHQCPGCGADMRFDIKKQMLFCSHCDKSMSVAEYDKEVKGAIERTVEVAEEEMMRVVVYQCPQCGGELLTDENTVATFCSYCGNPQTLTSRIAETRRPKYIIPFKITKEEAFSIYRKKLDKSAFVPSEYKKNITVEKIRGIYMPFDVIKYSFKGETSIEGTKHYSRGDYSITDYYDLVSDLDYTYELSGHDTAYSFDDTLSEAICPFDVNGAVPFKEAYFSGFYADICDVLGDKYKDIYNDAVDDDIGRRMTASDSSYRKYVVSSEKAGSTVVARSTYEGNFSFFPVWFMCCKHATGRISYAVINGQTGDIACEIPLSPIKYIVSVIVLAAILFLAYYFLVDFSITAPTLLKFALILNVVGLVVGVNIRNKVEAREEEIANIEKGIQAANDVEFEAGVPEKEVNIPLIVGFIFMQLLGVLFVLNGIRTANTESTILGGLMFGVGLIAIAIPAFKSLFNSGKSAPKTLLNIVTGFLPILISILVLIFGSYHDDLYYYATIFECLMIIVLFINNIKMYNALTSRKLPQFNKRGGDE